MRNRMFEVYFPWSHVKISLSQNQFRDEVDRFAGWDYKAHFYGAVKHYGPFDDLIMEEKEAWGSTRQTCNANIFTYYVVY